MHYLDFFVFAHGDLLYQWVKVINLYWSQKNKHSNWIPETVMGSVNDVKPILDIDKW